MKQTLKKVKDQISKINKKEQNLEQELERTLELFKRMKLEAQIQKTANDLEKLGDKQNDLSEEKIMKNSLRIKIV